MYRHNERHVVSYHGYLLLYPTYVYYRYGPSWQECWDRRMRPPDVNSRIDKLHVVPVFERLDVDVLAVLARRAVWREYAAGAIVFLEGDIALGFYCLHSGWLKEVRISPE